MANRRRLLVTCANVIDVINNSTGDEEKISADKVDLSGFASGGGDTLVVAGAVLSKVYSDVPASGRVITFSTAFPAVVDPVEGDYNAIAFGKYGSQNVNVEVIQTPASVTIKPDRDGTKVRLIIAPLNSLLSGDSML